MDGKCYGVMIDPACLIYTGRKIRMMRLNGSCIIWAIGVWWGSLDKGIGFEKR